MAGLSAATSGVTQAAGLGTRIARRAMAGVWALNVIHEMLSGVPVQAPWAWGAYAAGLGGALLLTQDGHRELAQISAWTLAACAVLAGTVLFAHADAGADIWMFNFACYLPALLIPRGNPVIGSICGGLLLILCAVYLWTHEGFTASGAALLTVPVLALVCGFIWRAVFRRMVRREQRFGREAEESRLVVIAAEERLAASSRAINMVREEAETLLERLARVERIDFGLRREIVAVEAGLRDRIRSPQLRHPRLDPLIFALRRRGGRVRLLGVQDGPPIGDELALALAAELGPLGDGCLVTLRQSRQPTSEVTLLIHDSDARRRMVFDERGTEIE